MTTLSAVVPVHNGADTVSDALTSLQRNAEHLVDVIVVDDGSSDDSVGIAEAHPLRPRIIRLPENRGVAFARNTGLLEASGDYVCFLDQDDLWLPGRAARLLEHLSPAADSVLVTGEQVFAAAEDREALEEMRHPFSSWVGHWPSRSEVSTLLDDVELVPAPLPPTEIPPRRIVNGPVTVTTSYALPRVLSLQVGGFACWIKGADDWVLLQTLSRYAVVRKLDEASVLYRVHPSNTSVRLDWPIPLATAAAALRRGGGVAEPGSRGGLMESDLLMHQLQQSVRTPGQLLDTLAAWRLLTVDRNDRHASFVRLAKSALTGRNPTRGIVDAVRPRAR